MNVYTVARCLPVRWDGSLEDLPKGIDDAIVRGIDEGDGNALRAMVIQVPRSLQGRQARQQRSVIVKDGKDCAAKGERFRKEKRP